MVILQATIIGLIIVAASVAARVIAATDHRLSLPPSEWSRSQHLANECPLSGVKRTSVLVLEMSVPDPKATSRNTV
jgi:hypothetical protein